jgi:hypothetical protein
MQHPVDRAAAGALQLDRHRPGWAEQIRRPVDINRGRHCPLGQVFGSYWRAPFRLRWRGRRRGFYPLLLTADHGDDATLNLAWEAQVAVRKLGAGPWAELGLAA